MFCHGRQEATTGATWRKAGTDDAHHCGAARSGHLASVEMTSNAEVQAAACNHEGGDSVFTGRKKEHFGPTQQPLLIGQTAGQATRLAVEAARESQLR